MRYAKHTHAAKRTLAILALTTTTLVGCTTPVVPANNTPDTAIEPLRLYATTATAPLTRDLATAYTAINPLTSFENRDGNYQAALDGLTNDDAAYIITTHLPANSPLWAAPIGQDGISIITHTDVDVSDISLAQLRAIYQGMSANWRDLNGLDAPIIPFSREDGSGTRAEFDRLVMGQRTTILNARVAPSSQTMIERVATTPGAIGYVSSGYLRAQAALPALNILTIEGSQPTLANIRANIYPLRSTLLVAGALPPEGAYLTFIAWIQSMDGQQIVSGNYAPLTP